MKTQKDKSNGEILLYKTPEGDTQVDVKLEDETVWLTLNQIAKLLQKDKSVISRHIHNRFDEKELVRNSTAAKFATVQNEGNRDVQRIRWYFNLDVIISVGYRVKSKRGTQFRIWANKIGILESIYYTDICRLVIFTCLILFLDLDHSII